MHHRHRKELLGGGAEQALQGTHNMDLHCYLYPGKSHYHHPIRSAKRKLYQRDLEENRAAEKQNYEDNSDSILAATIGKTLKQLSDLLNVCNTRPKSKLQRGTGVLELSTKLPSKGM